MSFNPYSSYYHQVSNISVPYSGTIQNGLTPGRQIYISGQVSHNADRFAINLQTSQGIAFHFNPRFNDNVIVRNSNSYGNWANEERHGGFPLRRGERFKLTIACEQDKFRVLINGYHVFDFFHRQPYQEIHSIEISGDVSVQQLLFSGQNAHEHRNISSPASLPLHGMNPGKLIQVNGQVNHHTDRFVINLQNGAGSDAQNIALHLSIRFDDGYTGTAFVRTNRSYGNWGAEERHGEFPFQKGQRFEMLILCEHSGWKIAVNGRHVAEMAHRNSFTDANFLHLDGNVQIHSIKEFN